MHADKHQNFLQFDLNALIVKVSLMVILPLLIGMIKHSQITQACNIFTAISLQYLKKEVMERVHFLHADKHRTFYNFLSFLVEVTRHVQSTQNRKLIMFMQYLKKEYQLFNFVCGEQKSLYSKGHW